MKKLNSKSGLLVCYHTNNIPVVKSNALRSILLNASSHNPPKREEFDFYDDDGVNISRYNSIYAELTALYYIWKKQIKNIFVIYVIIQPFIVVIGVSI
jgi:hypothetical protein